MIDHMGDTPPARRAALTHIYIRPASKGRLKSGSARAFKPKLLFHGCFAPSLVMSAD
ncbi:hypothetical protein WOC76_15880 [Methylocystis sp. IM3]|jgi:hypothetical protein|uniref:hypothetical protein n=1 Tax=unclassified Methylocystis TaxID=2625913 RepID=UPI0030F4D551